MRGPPKEHGFTSVDEQADPQSWIGVLDRIREEPAYAAYKARVAELLLPSLGGRYLDVGCGTGADALELAARFEVDVAGVDASLTMVQEARRRGLGRAEVADAVSLPFGAATFDGCWADRTLQHLVDPQAALAELVRVTRRGGRVVVADPDYDTQVVELADRELARRVLRFRADHLLRNGALAHRVGGLLVAAGFVDVTVEAFPIVLRDPTSYDNAMGLRSWAATASERGHLSREDANAWERQIDDAVAEGRFLYAFTVFVTAGSKP